MTRKRHAVSMAQREAAVSARERAVEQREQAIQTIEDAARATTSLNASKDEDLREANEMLVIASVSAQVMAQNAELATAKMTYLAEHDPLTGLPNRSLLRDRLTQALVCAQRYGRRGALMFLDLDDFKQINDSLGHFVGDALLQSTAQRLQRNVRGSDTVGRQGGDEFVVLLSEIGAPNDAVLLAQKLLQAMAEPHDICGQHLHVGTSIGISIFPDDANTLETVMRNADRAMYAAKSSGRNALRLFSAENRIPTMELLRHVVLSS